MSIKLVYLGHILLGDKASPRIYDVISPVLKGYHGRGYPTLTINELQDRGLIPQQCPLQKEVSK